MPSLHHVAIALGGNQGNMPESFRGAVEKLSARILDIRMSSIFITSPVDCVPGTPDFHNAAVTGLFDGSPEELLDFCQGIEQQMGRPHEHSSHESRPIDLDILLFDNLLLQTPRLCIPHPRMSRRRFVLEPLAQLLPDAQVPGCNRSVSRLLQELE